LMESVRVVEEPKLAPEANADAESNQPRGWLTGDERELIAGITDDDEYTEDGQNIAKGLLARSTPPEVVLPETVCWVESNFRYYRVREVRDALAAAGVAVKEVGRE